MQLRIDGSKCRVICQAERSLMLSMLQLMRNVVPGISAVLFMLAGLTESKGMGEAFARYGTIEVRKADMISIVRILWYLLFIFSTLSSLDIE